MNENQVENLLSQHGNQIEARLQPALVKRRTAWKPILVTGTALVVLGVFTLVPRTAEAAPIEKIKDAFSKAEYWTADISESMTQSHRSDHKILSNFKGKIRLDVFQGQLIEQTMLLDSGYLYQSVPKLPCVTKTKQPKHTLTEMVAAPFDHSLLFMDPKIMHKSEISQLNGRSVYFLTYSEPKNQFKFEGVFDSSSNLPVQVTMEAPSSSQTSDGVVRSRGVFRRKVVYNYDKPLGFQPFTLDSRKIVVDRSEYLMQLKQSWSKQAATDFQIYSATVSPDGLVWIAYGNKAGNKPSLEPARIPGGNYARVYVNNSSLDPGFRIHGNTVAFACFAPLSNLPVPETIDIALESTTRNVAKATKTISVKLGKETGHYPSYYQLITTVAPNDLVNSTEIQILDAVAHGNMAKGDYKLAAENFENEFESQRDNPFLQSYSPLLAAAKCYEKLGQMSKADELRAKAASLGQAAKQ